MKAEADLHPSHRFTVPVDSIPYDYATATYAAARELAQCVNELPESVYHLSPDDARWITERMLSAYRVALRRFLFEAEARR